MKNFVHVEGFKVALFLTIFIVTAVDGQCDQHELFINYERLFPVSCYGQAIEICMRVLADRTNQYDPDTATDLCVGRLVRLASTVVKMERRHKSINCYPPEDIAYIIGLIGVVHKERKEDLELSHTALSLAKSIESRLALLLRYY